MPKNPNLIIRKERTMLFIIGIFLMSFGGFECLILMINLSRMSSFEKYFAQSEIFRQLGIWGLVFIVGAVLTLIAVMSKKKKDSEALFRNLHEFSKSKCPSCGLNVTLGTQFCPQCHSRIGGNENG